MWLTTVTTRRTVRCVFRNDQLRRARARRKLTQEELSDRVRALGAYCRVEYIARWETGRAAPDCVRFAALCKVLRVQPSFLVDFDTEREAA